MAHKRLINCDFINASSFNKLDNDAKLLYVYMFVNADDKGFCDKTNDLMEILKISNKALDQLKERSLVLEFENKHGNKIHLIKHWYCHNKYQPKLFTTYFKYLKQVELIEGEYEWKKEETIIKEENKVNENTDKLNEIKLNENKLNPDDYPFGLD